MRYHLDGVKSPRLVGARTIDVVSVEEGLCSALMAGGFFLFRQEKVTKKKATPAPRSATPTALRYSSSRAAAQLGPAALKQCSPTSPGLPALLGASQGDLCLNSTASA